MWIYAVGVLVAVLSTASFAFEEQKMRPSQAPATAAGQAVPGGAGKQDVVPLVEPGLAVQRSDSGTKIRVPGLGVIGEIPKMDFGLELLYGASQPKGSELDRGEGNGVMGRVTVPLKSPR